MERSEMEKNLEQLKSSLASGELTGSELVRRLQVMIHNELTKPEEEVDIEFIEACSSLIERIYPKIAERPEGYYEEQEAKFKLRLKQEEKALRHRRVLRPVIAIAAVLIIAFLGIGSIQFRWFTRESTPDQQQYVIQGHQVSVDMVEKAIAEHLGDGSFETNDIGKLEAYLGFPISDHMIQSENWEISRLTCFVTSLNVALSAQYDNNEENKSLNQFITWFSSAENASMSFEQNAEGDIKVINGNEVYFSANYDYYSCIWIEDLAVYAFNSNTLQFSELESLIKEL